MRDAVKFAPEGGKVPGRRRRGHPEQVRFYVEDDGRASPLKPWRRSGRPFEQGSVVMANGMKGSGLPLAIANSLVELHGGTLRLQSRAGEGAVAVVTLPRVPRRLRAPALARVA